MAAILGPGDHLRQHNLPQIVRGDQLWRGTICGVTVPTFGKGGDEWGPRGNTKLSTKTLFSEPNKCNNIKQHK